MSIIPWRNKQNTEPQKAISEHPLAEFRSEFDKLVENFFGESWGHPTFKEFLPSLDVSEDGQNVVVSVEVPGIEPENLDVSLSGNTLTIQGEKTEEKEDKNFHHVERHFGSFKRVVQLPTTVDPDGIKADFKNGVLKLTAPKLGGSEKKKIPIFG